MRLEDLIFTSPKTLEDVFKSVWEMDKKKDLHKGVKSACETGFDKTCGGIGSLLGLKKKWNEDDTTYSFVVDYNQETEIINYKVFKGDLFVNVSSKNDTDSSYYMLSIPEDARNSKIHNEYNEIDKTMKFTVAKDMSSKRKQEYEKIMQDYRQKLKEVEGLKKKESELNELRKKLSEFNQK
jgi:hypothetical protein